MYVVCAHCVPYFIVEKILIYEDKTFMDDVFHISRCCGINCGYCAFFKALVYIFSVPHLLSMIF